MAKEDFNKMGIGELIAYLIEMSVSYTVKVNELLSTPVSDAARESGYNPERVVESLKEKYLRNKEEIVTKIDESIHKLMKK